MEKRFEEVCTEKAKVGITKSGQRFYYCPKCGYREMA
jgi:predicted RNA-binding Zn-ribbon protein involved in translation (DUF1610 family)